MCLNSNCLHLARIISFWDIPGCKRKVSLVLQASPVSDTLTFDKVKSKTFSQERNVNIWKHAVFYILFNRTSTREIQHILHKLLQFLIFINSHWYYTHLISSEKNDQCYFLYKNYFFTLRKHSKENLENMHTHSPIQTYFVYKQTEINSNPINNHLGTIKNACPTSLLCIGQLSL